MDKKIHTFPKGISMKVNVITSLDFEATVQHFIHYAMDTPHVYDGIGREFCIISSFQKTK